MFMGEYLVYVCLTPGGSPEVVTRGQEEARSSSQRRRLPGSKKGLLYLCPATSTRHQSHKSKHPFELLTNGPVPNFQLSQIYSAAMRSTCDVWLQTPTTEHVLIILHVTLTHIVPLI